MILSIYRFSNKYFLIPNADLLYRNEFDVIDTITPVVFNTFMHLIINA